MHKTLLLICLDTIYLNKFMKTSINKSDVIIISRNVKIVGKWFCIIYNNMNI